MTVLLFGATGTIGPFIASALKRDDLKPRALVRDIERARAVLGEGIDLRQGDFNDSASVLRALDGATGMVLLTPHGPDMDAVQANLVAVARPTGVHVVKISATHSAVGPDGPGTGRRHFAVEEILAASGLPYTHLRPNAFMQTMMRGIAASVKAQGVVANPLGTAGLSTIDAADIGNTVAAVFKEPAAHVGKTYVLTGPAAVTYPGIARIIGVVTGGEPRVVDVTIEQVAATVRARAGEWEAHHQVEMLELFKAHGSEYVTGDVEMLTGHQPRSAENFIRHNAALFARN